MRFGADRCKSLRYFIVPRADFAWDNRVQAISSAAKAGIPDRLGHARGHASALSPSVADPEMQQRGRSHTVGTASDPLPCLYGRCPA
jgi:hypothetical protein